MLKILLCLLLLCGSWAQAADVRLAWNANSEADLAGYRIHYGMVSGNYTSHVDVGNITATTISGLADGTRYYFAATAYNTLQNESGYSNEVNWQSGEGPVYIGAVITAASRYQVEAIMADSTLYTNALAIYDFENNANDTKGSKNLTTSGTVGYNTTGEAQGSYWTNHFMGDGYFTRTDADFRLTSGDWALSFWFDCDYVTSGVGPDISCADGTHGWRVNMDGSRHIAVTHYVSGTARTSTFSGYAFNDSTRYHVVIFYDDSADTYTCWASTTSFGNAINGTTVAQTYNPTSSTEVFRINNGPAGEGYGHYDEVVFWKGTEISSSDASAIFAARDGGTSWRETGGSSAVPVIMRSYRARRN